MSLLPFVRFIIVLVRFIVRLLGAAMLGVAVVTSSLLNLGVAHVHQNVVGLPDATQQRRVDSPMRNGLVLATKRVRLKLLPDFF